MLLVVPYSTDAGLVLVLHVCKNLFFCRYGRVVFSFYYLMRAFVSLREEVLANLAYCVKSQNSCIREDEGSVL